MGQLIQYCWLQCRLDHQWITIRLPVWAQIFVSQLHPGRRIQENYVLLGHYAAISANVCTDVSGQPIGPIFKVQESKKIKPTRWVTGSTLLPIHLVPGDTFSDTRVATGWCWPHTSVWLIIMLARSGHDKWVPVSTAWLGLKPWFLTTTQWHLRKRDAARRSQSCGFEGGLVFKGRAHVCAAVTLHGCLCVVRLRHPILDFCVTTQKSVTVGRKSCCLLTAVVFLCTMSCKEESDEKLIDCVRNFPVIYDLSKKSYKD